jgi:signal transduction histidine kinase
MARDVTERRRAETELERLADEQAALRRVATLVAQAVPPSELFHAVAREVGTLLAADLSGMIRYEDHDTVTAAAAWAAVGEHPPIPERWHTEPGDPTTMIAETEEPARVDDWTTVPGPIAAFLRDDVGVSSSVGSPILVEGRLWGALAVHSKQPVPLPPETETRIAQFSALVATAIANAEARAEVERLADEQAALRRVATLVAEGSAPTAIFDAVAGEMAALLDADQVALNRFEPGAEIAVLAHRGLDVARTPVGSRVSHGGESVTATVRRTGRPARMEDYRGAPGALAELARETGLRASVGAPIVVDGRLWGIITASWKGEESPPADTEERMARFAQLLDTAIANADARTEVERLADEQAALRRVATLIARGMGPEQVFQAVADEVHALLDTDASGILRFEADETVAVLGARGAPYGPGARLELDSDFMLGTVRRTGRAARVETDDPADARVPEGVRAAGLRSAVAHPILVEGGVWGAIAVGSSESPMPAVTEARLAGFTELVATAVANTDAREQVTALAEEQAALRRVATLVAEGVSPTEVFDAVAAEVERVLGADRVSLSRYEPGAEITVLAHRGSGAELVPTGSRLSHEGDNVQEMVRRTERPARMADFHGAHGRIAEVQRTMGVGTVVAAPVVVDGRLWGVIGASWVGEESPPADTEERLAQFAGLLDTAIANADSRDQLTASRARLVTEGDEARRRVVRDLHDGAQQRLVHTIVTLKLAQRAFRQQDGKAESLLREALEHAEQGNEELRELAHGILPAILTRGGLRAGIDAVVMRLDLPVRVDIPAERFPLEIEASAYFIVAEALTNVVKHSHAEHAEVRASVEDGMLHVEVRDDGIGGADPSGHGLVGMGDRVAALGGRLRIESPAGGGTRVAAALPFSGG